MKNYAKCFIVFLVLISSSTQIWVNGQEIMYPRDIEEKMTLYVDGLIKKDNNLQNLSALSEGEIYIPEGELAENQRKLKRIAAYDVGSTSVKFKLMDVDPSKHKIVNVIYSTIVPTKFEIKEEDFLDRIAIMAGLKTLVEEYFPHYSKIEHNGIATAGFRAAGERGLRLAKEISDIVGIDFKVIDQNYEGLLAYYGVLAKEPAFNSSKDIVWDVGGGSSQLIASEVSGDVEKMIFLGVAVGGVKFNEIVLKTFFGGDAASNASLSENPMSYDEIKGLIKLTKNWLTNEKGPFMPAVFNQVGIEFIKSKVANGGEVYGIGAMHNFVVKVFVDNNFGTKSYYTKEEVGKILEMIVDRDDEYIYNNIKKDKKDDPKFTKIDSTSLILIYAMMDTFGIERVYPVNVSNLDGIAIKSIIDNEMEKKGDIKESEE